MYLKSNTERVSAHLVLTSFIALRSDKHRTESIPTVTTAVAPMSGIPGGFILVAPLECPVVALELLRRVGAGSGSTRELFVVAVGAPEIVFLPLLLNFSSRLSVVLTPVVTGL